MLQLLSFLLKPLIDAIYKDEPSTIEDILKATGKAITGFIVIIALYSLSLAWLNTGEFLDKITITKYAPSLTSSGHLLTAISVAVLLRILGARTLMRIKELARPLLREILGDYERAKGRAEQAAITRAWLEEQRRAGKTIEDLDEIPIPGEEDLGNGHKEQG